MLFEIAIALNIAGWIAYIVWIVRNKTQTEPIQWMLSLMMLSASGLSLAMNGNFMAGLMYLSGGIPAIIVIIMSLRNYTTPSTYDIVIIALAALTLVIALHAPLVSMLAVSAYYIMNYSVFIKNTLKFRTQESLTPWMTWVVAGIAQLIAILDRNHLVINSDLVIPSVLLTLWTLMTGAILVSRDGRPSK